MGTHRTPKKGGNGQRGMEAKDHFFSAKPKTERGGRRRGEPTVVDAIEGNKKGGKIGREEEAGERKRA